MAAKMRYRLGHTCSGLAQVVKGCKAQAKNRAKWQTGRGPKTGSPEQETNAMARGYLSGVFWGGTTGVVIAGIASTLAPLPGAPEIGVTAPLGVGVPEAVVVSDVSDSGLVVDPDALNDAPKVAAQPSLSAQPGNTAATSLPEQTETALPAAPETGTAEALETPQAAPQSGGVTLAEDELVLPSPQTVAPSEPSVATQPFVVTQTPVPSAPAPGLDTSDLGAPEPLSPLGSDANVAEVDLPQPSGSDEAAVTTRVPAPAPTVPLTPLLPTADEAPAEAPEAQKPVVTAQDEAPETPNASRGETAEEDAQQEDMAEAEAETREQPEAAQPLETAQATPAETAPAETTPTETASVETAPAEDTPVQILPKPEPGQAQTTSLRPTVRSALGKPAIQLTQRSNGVTIRRPTSTEADVTPAVATPAAASLSSDTPLGRNALAFENTDGKPLMSIVLIDDGTSVVDGRAGLAALSNFPHPITFAVDTKLSDFEDRVQTYRDANFEVMALIDMPLGATASDAETTFSATLPKLENVVGVLEGVAGGLQGSREASDQVTIILAESGHGLVTQDKGLNTMPKLAVKEGVPAAPVFRDFDSNEQTARVIRRFLDQAAFKAGQEGAVIMQGRIRPETITALLLWGLQDRAAQVAIAPISAVLAATQ